MRAGLPGHAPRLSSMSLPLVSVCIPAYNADAFLRETLASVAAQTFTDWEVIVLEDGSKDRTEAIVREFAQTVAQRVLYTRHAVNRGLPVARNSAHAEARGEWIAMLDADDLWDPNHLESLVEMASKQSCDVVSSASSSFDSATGKRLEDWAQQESCIQTFPISLYKGEFVILPSSAMIRRAAFDRYGPVSDKYRACNDTELFFRLASKGGRFVFTRTTTCRYRRHTNSLSHAHTTNLTELAHLYQEYAEWKEIPVHLRRTKPADLYRYAGKSALGNDIRLARSLFLLSLRARPIGSSTWYFYLRSFLPTRKRRVHKGAAPANALSQAKGTLV